MVNTNWLSGVPGYCNSGCPRQFLRCNPNATFDIFGLVILGAGLVLNIKGGKDFIYFYFLMYGCFAYISVYVPPICSAHRGLKTALYPLGVELEMVVSLHVGVGNWTQVF